MSVGFGSLKGFTFNESYNFHGGAVLADASCGSVSVCNRVGDVLTINLDHDPEWTMSGLTEPCKLSEKW
ncbi:hypothetical protein D3C81_1639510 [compost metagenome]